MAKCINSYVGNDTYGRLVELAERTDGQYFFREYVYNGYGKGFTKWSKYTNDVVLDSNNDIEYGFQKLRSVGQTNYRLPNN